MKKPKKAAAAHGVRAHARLGGSAAGIFTACTGAPALWAGRVRTASSYAREGTLAHQLIEDMLVHSRSPVIGSVHDVEGLPVAVDPEMALAVQDYCAFAEALRDDCDWCVIEQTFDMDALWTSHGLTPPERMFGTVDFAAIKGPLLTVLDFKYGKGVGIAADTPQLYYYALGIYLALPKPESVKTIRLVVHQPRIDVTPKAYDIPAIDLLLWGYTVLRPAVDNIHAGTTTLVAGKHCQFCVARGDCPELYKQALAVAQNKFPPVQPVLLTDDEINLALTQADTLSTWINGVRAEGERRIREGRSLPDWKMVAKKGYRAWSDPDAVLNTLDARGITLDECAPRELLSPAQVEKLLRSKGLTASLVSALIVAPVVGVTLVPATDKRPAVPVAPQDVFTDAGEPD